MCIQWAHVLYSVGRPTMFAHLNNTSQVEAQNVYFQSLPQFLTLSNPFFTTQLLGKYVPMVLSVSYLMKPLSLFICFYVISKH